MERVENAIDTNQSRNYRHHSSVCVARYAHAVEFQTNGNVFSVQKSLSSDKIEITSSFNVHSAGSVSPFSPVDE